MTRQEKLATLHKTRFEINRTQDDTSDRIKMSSNVVMGTALLVLEALLIWPEYFPGFQQEVIVLVVTPVVISFLGGLLGLYKEYRRLHWVDQKLDELGKN